MSPYKSSTKMLAYYLNALKEFMDDVKEKAWGVVVLAYFYRQLGLVSRIDVKQISGCLSLLMAWIYDHFPMLPNASPKSSYDESHSELASRKTPNLAAIRYWLGQSWQHHVLDTNLRSTAAVNPWDCEDNYMKWFKTVSHPIIQNPCACVSSKGNNLHEFKANRLVEATKMALLQLNANINGGSPKENERRDKNVKVILKDALLDVNESPPSLRCKKAARKSEKAS